MSQNSDRFNLRRMQVLTLLLLVLILLLAGCTKTLHQSDFLRPYKKTIVPDTVERRNVEILAADSTSLHGWFLSPKSPGGSLIYFYGNAETVRDFEYRLFWLADRFNLIVLAVDYRGYGFSEGSPSAEKLMQDATVIYDTLQQYLGAERKPVLVYGRSLGSFVAVDLASKRPIDGMILEGTVTSLADALPSFKRLAPWYIRWAISLRLGEDLLRLKRPIDQIQQLSVPVLIIQGEKDELFPVAFAKKIYEASPAKDKRWCPVPGAGHNGLSIYDQPALGCLDEFVSMFQTEKK
jgi:pimeloyl-ACP methyl ester carboxylesterase